MGGRSAAKTHWYFRTIAKSGAAKVGMTCACLDPAVHTHVVHVVGGGELLAAQRVWPGEVELLQAGLEKTRFFLKTQPSGFFGVFLFFLFFLVFLYICPEFSGFFQFQE
jgi:hypothetical protein